MKKGLHRRGCKNFNILSEPFHVGAGQSISSHPHPAFACPAARNPGSHKKDGITLLTVPREGSTKETAVAAFQDFEIFTHGPLCKDGAGVCNVPFRVSYDRDYYHDDAEPLKEGVHETVFEPPYSFFRV